MNIEKNVNGAVTTLKIIGRLDTTTAPALEATIDGCITGVQELILDCTALEYVSSAGLRVLLKSQKQMNAQGFADGHIVGRDLSRGIHRRRSSL